MRGCWTPLSRGKVYSMTKTAAKAINVLMMLVDIWYAMRAPLRGMCRGWVAKPVTSMRYILFLFSLSCHFHFTPPRQQKCQESSFFLWLWEVTLFFQASCPRRTSSLQPSAASRPTSPRKPLRKRKRPLLPPRPHGHNNDGPPGGR